MKRTIRWCYLCALWSSFFCLYRDANDAGIRCIKKMWLKSLALLSLLCRFSVAWLPHFNSFLRYRCYRPFGPYIWYRHIQRKNDSSLCRCTCASLRSVFCGTQWSKHESFVSSLSRFAWHELLSVSETWRRGKTSNERNEMIARIINLLEIKLIGNIRHCTVVYLRMIPFK